MTPHSDHPHSGGSHCSGDGGGGGCCGDCWSCNHWYSKMKRRRTGAGLKNYC